MTCEKHKRYQAKRPPAKTRDNPEGCRTCWLVYRAKFIEAAIQASAEAEKIRVMLAANCKHDPEHVEDWPWEHDDGYGRQKMITGKRCRLCHARKCWDSSVHWTSEHDWLNRRRDD